MRINRMVITMGFSFLLAIGLLPFTAHGAEQKAEAVAVPTQPAVAASGAVEDTLPICLKRIPQDATLGQRLIAEQSCQRDESVRSSMQAVPGR
jgi:hypothetical protein